MREISPAIGITADEYLQTYASEHRELVEVIRAQKRAGARPRPSSSLIDKSSVLTSEKRRHLIDAVAELVDENLFGRSDMCQQFATLLQRALAMFHVDSRVVMGTGIYYEEHREIFRWDHSWVRIRSEVVDGNTDVLFENPLVPENVKAAPFWGDVSCIPQDRRLRENRGATVLEDEDLENLWWPELEAELKNCILKS